MKDVFPVAIVAIHCSNLESKKNSFIYYLLGDEHLFLPERKQSLGVRKGRQKSLPGIRGFSFWLWTTQSLGLYAEQLGKRAASAADWGAWSPEGR